MSVWSSSWECLCLSIDQTLWETWVISTVPSSRSWHGRGHKLCHGRGAVAWQRDRGQLDAAWAALSMRILYSVTTKWLPSLSLATECIENVLSFILEASVKQSHLFRACYKMKWVYFWTGMNGQGSLELALEKTNLGRMTKCIFYMPGSDNAMLNIHIFVLNR